MAAERNEWTLATRHSKGRGGIHIYIDSTTLGNALDYAGIPRDAVLMVKRFPVRDKKNVAQIMLKLRDINNPPEENGGKVYIQ